jgi:hypothetical protein
MSNPTALCEVDPGKLTESSVLQSGLYLTRYRGRFGLDRRSSPRRYWISLPAGRPAQR